MALSKRTFGFLALILTFNLVNAYAQECDAIVVDEARVFGNQLDEVEEAAKRIQSLGAEVRIRTFNLGNQMDFVQEDMERRCQSWRAPGGGRRNNLISLLFSLEGQFGTYGGSQWRSALESRMTEIENDYIFPRFGDDEFAEGFIAGLGQIERILNARANGSLSSSAGGAAAVVVQSEPTDLTGLWWVMGSVLFIGLIFMGYVAYDRKRKEGEKRRAAQQRALMAKREVGAVINSISDNLPSLEARIAAVSSMLSGEDSSSLIAELGKVRQSVDAASEAFARIGMGKSDAEQDNLTAEEYSNIEAEYNRLKASVYGKETLESNLTYLSNLAKELPAEINRVKSVISTVDAQIADIEKQGFRVAARDVFSIASASIEEAEKAYGNKEMAKAERFSKLAESRANDALSSAKALPETRAAILRDVENLKTGIAGAQALTDEGFAAFIRISDEFAQECWESVKGNGVEAEERLDWASASVEEVVSLAGMEMQEWDKAFDLIGQVSKRTGEACSLMRSITALENNLRAAKNDPSKEISDAQADITKAWAYIREHDDDISEDRESELQRAEAVLKSAKTELAKDKPNYLLVVKSAKEANSAADKILENARSEHEAMERLRQKAASSSRDAKAAYSKAKEYIEDHSSDVGSAAETDLKEANVYLRGLVGVTDLNRIVEWATKAEVSANNAYKKAKKKVDDAEEEREKARRRRAAAASTSISGSSGYRSSSRSSSGSSFGSSRSWGSSSGGFGSSRSFSGGGGGFGRSRSWK